jgi:glycosyltransferase involved in cell wall biosynthesis
MSTPLVSVIVPIHDGAEFLADALGSVFARDYSPFTVIAVDDASSDNGAQIARSFAAVRYIYQSHQGIAAAGARNSKPGCKWRKPKHA